MKTKQTQWGNNLLNIDSNAKTVKGQKRGYMTGVLYLAPSTLSGYQVCPFAKAAKCEKGCLNTAGRGTFDSVQKARIAKTKALMEHRDAFMTDLVASIFKLAKQAAKRGLTPVVRLNGTSDIKWESFPFVYRGSVVPNIMSLFPTVQFYDYTKRTDRDLGILPANYHLTFSISGARTVDYFRARRVGFRNFAAVFRTKQSIPDVFHGLETVDGDETDLRFLDRPLTVAALYAKGQARKDYDGFVID